MIKQRNVNSFHDNKGWFIKDKVQSPFNRSNPYKVKAQFFSQKKKATIDMDISGVHMRKSSRHSNTQSLKYHRNYKQSPPTTSTIKTLSSGKLLLKDNYILMKNNTLTRSLNSMSQLQQHQYRTRLKQYVTQKYCPSDMYLNIVKDKFMYFNNQNSQFQHVMKMSNLGISRLSNVNNNSNKYTKAQYSTVSYKDRMNPFYRKSLLSTQKDSELLLYGSVYGSNKGEYFPQVISAASNIPSYSYSAIAQLPSTSHHQHMNSKVYQIIIPPPSDPKHYIKQRKNSIYSQQSGSRVSNNNPLKSNQYMNGDGLIPSMKELDASFGVDYGSREKNHIIRPFIDAVIEQRLQDPLRIQSMAPKTIKIQGKIFYLNRVNR